MILVRLAQVCTAALVMTLASWIDPDTPLDRRTVESYSDGKTYDLVMSDEFERPGRSFRDGHDPMWTGPLIVHVGLMTFYHERLVFTLKG